MTALTPNVRKLIAHAVLGLVLLFAQQQAVLHWLSHAVEATHSKAKGTPDDGRCLECDGLAVLGGGFLPAAPSSLPALPHLGEVLRPSLETQQAPTLLAAAYQPRAPPSRD